MAADLAISHWSSVQQASVSLQTFPARRSDCTQRRLTLTLPLVLEPRTYNKESHTQAVNIRVQPHLCRHSSSSTLRSTHCVGIEEALKTATRAGAKVLLPRILLLPSHLLLPTQLLLHLQLQLQELERGHPLRMALGFLRVIAAVS
jgi:hypothetical protein